MPYGIADKSFKLIIAIFAKYKNIKKAVLYGSRVMGNYKEGSDINITLLSDTLSLKEMNNLHIELDDLMLPYIFDLSDYIKIKNKDLKDHIKRVGIVIYKKGES